MPARNTRGDQSEAEPLVQIICSIPAAAAERNKVPTLPGSCTFSKISVSALKSKAWLELGTSTMAKQAREVPKVLKSLYKDSPMTKTTPVYLAKIRS